jgi:hypothetical protein
MTIDELKALITDWASTRDYAEGNIEDAEAQAKEAIKLVDDLNQAAITERPRIANAATDMEIEITDKMIEAGVRALVSYNSDFETEERAVTRIYKSMASILCNRHR